MDVTQTLVELGAEINVKDKNGQKTPLHVAAQYGDSQFYLKALAIFCWASIWHWCNWIPGKTDVIRVLVEYGADVNAEDNVGETPLHKAVMNSQHSDVVRVLIEKGADVNAENQRGMAPLHTAVSRGNYKQYSSSYLQQILIYLIVQGIWPSLKL